MFDAWKTRSPDDDNPQEVSSYLDNLLVHIDELMQRAESDADWLEIRLLSGRADLLMRV